MSHEKQDHESRMCVDTVLGKEGSEQMIMNFVKLRDRAGYRKQLTHTGGESLCPA